jgi:hypothetical protein
MEEKCNQHNCEEPADFRFTWPGQPERGICKKHVQKLKQVAQACGLYIEPIPIDEEETDGR